MSYVFIRETDINITDSLEDPASEQESVSRQGRGQADPHQPLITNSASVSM